MLSIVRKAVRKVVKHQVDKKKTANNLFLRGSQIQFDHIQWPFRQPFLSQVSPKTVLKSTVWNNTQARLHHDQHDGPETLTRWRMDIWKCSGQSRNFSSWLIFRSCPKQAKVKNKEIVLSQVEKAKVDKANWQIKKSGGKKKSPSCESTNQTTQTKNCPIKITIETKVQKYVGICISCWI